MESKQNISEYRGRLDKTLASYDLADEETLKNIIKNQMLQSLEFEEYSGNVVEKRTKEVSNFLQMLRSASVIDDDGSKTKETCHRGWKVKQDTEEYRVMYREGPQGTAFHTLLVEGYVDGPVDVCLCISWESTLYQKWWPVFSIPPFRILSSKCLQKVRIGEQISLVRMKVPWPLSAREAVVHYFEFEYFQDDLVVVLLNTISDFENIDRSTHGFTKDGIPDVQDVVRIDVVGGFAIQKVDAGRSYFRTIVNMDIKLDFVPPSFINFVSRQLIGSGFRLYQKEVASVSKGDDEDFGKALSGQLYDRIRKALYSDGYQNRSIESEHCKIKSRVLSLEHVVQHIQAEEENKNRKVFIDDHATDSLSQDTHYRPCCEIEEIEEEGTGKFGHVGQDPKEITQKCYVKREKKPAVSPEVQHALETLEKAISVVRECGLGPQTRSLQGLGNGQTRAVGESAVRDTKTSENGQISSNTGVVYDEVSENKVVDRSHNEPRNSSSSLCSRLIDSNFQSREANNNMTLPESPEEDVPTVSETQQTVFCSSNNENTEVLLSNGSTNGNKLVNADANNTCKNSPNEGKNKRLRYCCLLFNSGQLMS